MISIDGIFLVYAPKILSTPKPADQYELTIPTAPAFSSATGSVRVVYPDFFMRAFQLSVMSFRWSFIFLIDSAVPNWSQLSSGRPVGCNMEIITNFPLTNGIHAA